MARLRQGRQGLKGMNIADFFRGEMAMSDIKRARSSDIEPIRHTQRRGIRQSYRKRVPDPTIGMFKER